MPGGAQQQARTLDLRESAEDGDDRFAGLARHGEWLLDQGRYRATIAQLKRVLHFARGPPFGAFNGNLPNGYEM
jgi:hypothetical protein